MADLVEHVMINKLGDELDSAITFAGGDTTGVSNIMQYPSIIRDQLGKVNNKSIILEGDSCIIIADEEGRDQYNTEYAIGEKTGLNPGAYYIRICTAVYDIEPVYIDLTPIMNGITPGEVDIDKIIQEVINSPEIQEEIQNEVSKALSRLDIVPKEEFDILSNQVSSIDERLSQITSNDEGIDVNELKW